LNNTSDGDEGEGFGAFNPDANLNSKVVSSLVG